MLGYAVLNGFAALSLITVLLALGISGIRKAFRATPIFFGWSIFLGLCTLSVLGSLDPAGSAQSALLLGLILIFATLAAHFLQQSQNRIDFVHIGLMLASLGMIVLALIHIYGFQGLLRIIHFSSETTAHFDRVLLKKPASGFILIMPVALYLLWGGTNLLRMLSALVIVGILWLIIISESRSAMAAALALLTVMGFLAMIALRWRGGKIAIFILLVVSCIGIFALYMQQIRGDWATGALGIPGWIIDNARQILWREVLILLQQDFPSSILSGYGINALEELERGVREMSITAENTTYFTAISNHPHNWLLEIAAEVGLVGLISVLVACGLVLHWGWQQRHEAPAEVIALFGVYAAFTSASLFNYSIWSVWWQVAFAVMNALCAAMIVQRKASR